MKKILIVLLHLFAVKGFSQAFVTTWNTGTSNYIIIPGYGTNYNISWEEMGNASHNGSLLGTNTTTVNFGDTGTYKVSISGGSPAFNRINFGQFYGTPSGDSNSKKIIAVNDWGNIVWQRLDSAFARCNNLAGLPSSAPNLTLVTDLSYMFPSSAVNTDISNWDVSNVLSFEGMFYGANSFNKSLNGWNTSNAINFSKMFWGASAFNQSLNSWNMGNAKDCSYMFLGAFAFNQPLSNWNMEYVENAEGMFQFAYNFNQPLNNWNVGKVKNMKNMFFGTNYFDQPLSNWDTKNVEDVSYMFSYASSFNQSINNWNTSKVKNFSQMFSNAVSFNQPLNNWNVSSAIDMSQMFDNAYEFNQPINNWNFSNATTIAGMFNSAIKFNQPLNYWNTSNIQNMSDLFLAAYAFNQPINNWNTSNVINMSGVFSNAVAFNQPLNNWNTSSVVNMSGIFDYAKKFNQNIGMWDIRNIDTSSIAFPNIPLIGLSYSNIDVNNYDSILMGWSNQIITKLVSIEANDLKYCNAKAQRVALINQGVVITGDTISPNCLLPIQLTSFTAALQQAKVLLQWQTATEINNNYFTVQRSNNSKNWDDIATIKGSGNSSTKKEYLVTDSKPVGGINYYRIKQIDFNGSVNYSETRSVDYAVKAFVLYPNPAKDMVFITTNEKACLIIYDIAGKPVLKQNINVGNTRINTAKLINGLYFIEAIGVNSKYVLKLIINK